jgi:hypothetical protein
MGGDDDFFTKMKRCLHKGRPHQLSARVVQDLVIRFEGHFLVSPAGGFVEREPLLHVRQQVVFRLPVKNLERFRRVAVEMDGPKRERFFHLHAVGHVLRVVVDDSGLRPIK